jgi:orotate phosphoribosyltransferase
MSDVRGALLQQIKDKAVVHGKVTLSSGLEADYYVDLRRITLDGEAAPLVGQVLLDLTEELEFDAVGGLTMGADPVAAAMLHAAAARGRRLDAFVVRKAAKAHGLQRRVEGPPLEPGDRCLVVEDVVTTGGSTLQAIEALREESLEIVGVVSVLDRLAGGGERIAAAAGAPYEPLTTIDDIYPGRPDRP